METHLDSERAKSRRQELLMTFENMVNYGKQNQVSLIMIAGDLFDTGNNIQKRMKERVLDIISENSEIDFLYLQGNHDKRNILEIGKNPLKILSCFIQIDIL
jgi:DNA repair exonuclease SbcCD nuclease subunit